MEKIDNSRNWSRLAPTERVHRVKHQKEERYPRRQQKHPKDETEEKQTDSLDMATEGSAKRKKLQRRKPGHWMDLHDRKAETDEDDAEDAAPTGKRIDIRI